MQFSSDDIQMYYEIDGTGFPVVLLHPFPVHHEFWAPVRAKLANRYQLILPDLRGHGRSAPGKGTATMSKHARDLVSLLQAVNLPRAFFVGVSIGGYILFELWRQARERFAGLLLSNTRAEPDTDQGRTNRLKSIADSRLHGAGPFFDTQVQNLIGESTRRNRPDLVAQARAMMQIMTVEGLAAVQQGMAERPDSVPTLRTINVPTLIVAGEEDTLTPVANAQLMQKHISGARLNVLPRAGHYAAFENPEEYARVLRQFLDSLRLSS
ncbi:MAG TPA: alpha/beta fold hydrolase [Terriglobales bacterium]|nr:alpha/beta fold hydrolase [Terriglobales bacterium]